MFGLPWATAIEPTTSCNLRCPECPSGLKKFSRPTGSINMEDYKNIVDQLSPHLVYLTLYFQGEPFLNRHFFEMVAYARKRKIIVATSTNGHFLDDNNARLTVESGIDRLIISVDGADQKTYSSYRTGGNLEQVIQGIQNVIKWKKNLNAVFPIVEMQFLVLGTNENQMNEIRALARKLTVDKLTFKSAQNYSTGPSRFLTTLPAYSRYTSVDGHSLKTKSVFPNRCHRMWTSPVITWDGLIVPCCFDKDANYILGDLKRSKFSDCWKSESYKSFRKALFLKSSEIPICRNCTEGLTLS